MHFKFVGVEDDHDKVGNRIEEPGIARKRIR